MLGCYCIELNQYLGLNRADILVQVAAFNLVNDDFVVVDLLWQDHEDGEYIVDEPILT